MNGEEFLNIYSSFGYEQAFSRDETSLSYMYALDDTHWAMMLDTCQYEPVNRVNGRVKPETLAWIEEQLEYAEESDQCAVFSSFVCFSEDTDLVVNPMRKRFFLLSTIRYT